MAESRTHGEFVWHELLTSDFEAAIPFYTHVVGWTTGSFGDGGMDGYKMWVSSQGPLGGTMNLPEEAKKMGAHPNWIANVTVQDIQATVARVLELGGQVLSGPDSMAGVGSFAVISDPQGATIAVMQPETSASPQDPSRPGAFGWAELVTTDHRAAFAFYHAIFGWEKLGASDMGPMGEYLLFGNDGRQLGGMMTKSAGMPLPSIPTSWLYYIHVADLNAAIERATSSGGKLLSGPHPVPGTRIAQLRDPQGAVFALTGV